ncbi:MAG: fumarylacetoacetate hydrolase family protein, partial [Alphaproteobacteria bacterium]|nr:fumarylacetoacetate hydrolase family protein [Alphaproteobacteria bacterium]
QFKTMQSALDNWDTALGVLAAGSKHLEEHPGSGLPLPDFTHFHSPLPRAYQWVDGSAYVNHVELVRKARGADMPESFWTDPLMYQGASDKFVGPHDAIEVANESYGIDMEAEVAVITDDVPMGVSAKDAASHIKLIMIVNDVSLRGLIPGELAKGFGFLHGKPASAFSPFAITPAVLGDAWKDAKVGLPLQVEIKRKDGIYERFGAPNAGEDMTFNFGELVAHAAKTRHLIAGTIVGSGTVSNLDRSKGSCCLAERRMLETINEGKPSTPFLQFGDSVRISMGNPFGVIDQKVIQYKNP